MRVKESVGGFSRDQNQGKTKTRKPGIKSDRGHLRSKTTTRNPGIKSDREHLGPMAGTGRFGKRAEADDRKAKHVSTLDSEQLFDFGTSKSQILKSRKAFRLWYRLKPDSKVVKTVLTLESV